MSCKHISYRDKKAYIKSSTVLINNNYMDNREGTIVNIITYTNNRFTCYAKKVCINLPNSMYACLICLSLFFINRLHKELYFYRLVKVS